MRTPPGGRPDYAHRRPHALRRNINDQNVITNAVSCGTMFRGWRSSYKGATRAMRGRSLNVLRRLYWRTRPGFGLRHRRCYGIKVPDNANIIRNIMLATLCATIIWCTSISLPGWTGSMCRCAESRPAENLRTGAKSLLLPKSSPGYFFDVQNRLKKFVEAGSWGSSAMATGGTRSTSCARSQPDGLCPLPRSSRFPA